MVAVNRQTHAQRRLGLGLAALAAVIWSGAPAQAQQAEEKVLNVYNWSDYIGDDTIKNFTKETGITVRYDVFDSNEVLNAKLVAGKSGYDVVVPTAPWARQQIDGKLLRKLDKSKLPNLVNLDPGIQAKLATLDPGNEHLVDWMWGYTTVGINVDKVKAALGTTPLPANVWELIFNPAYTAKLKSCGVSFLDSPSEVFPAALHYMGKPAYSKNAADYAEAGKMLQAVRPSVTLFSSSGYINDMANGAICVAFGWAGDINIARQRAIDAKKGVKIEALVPKNGAPLVFDTMAIPADAPHPNNAHLWINYILRPDVQAGLTNKVFFANPNKAGMKFVRKDIAENKSVFLPDEDLKKMLPPEAVPQDIRRVMTRTYTKFKTGR
ncbi:polyamine ABC transporter substrate-binding protein [Massilia antarctica]|uniref:polyamine ABC transporter substrate-binding protein n=1 Tax=Massilia antarctica TaxID=2765360 RepID=UPI0006BB8506|nr:polyamine ABC transporter substrate-binding protein [Massilia sp. H27-R4]MCY0912652.1 polyamine ABC transporter substrate-binding protein [Massilia sp. H27-R4]CUI03715.1 Putrescine ABC transporter putrescine-binding protein PotF (TC 3.A.1.11.2) [Janthinobacterium sp. CG23_2]CUU27501.1 Putrescine ABC transporter putrescine-binding protein PotF (TC 3.A.1.11.2) [Janthinobacterium sp. CG23_2]